MVLLNPDIDCREFVFDGIIDDLHGLCVSYCKQQLQNGDEVVDCQKCPYIGTRPLLYKI